MDADPKPERGRSFERAASGPIGMVASAGGLKALSDIIDRLPGDFGAPLLVVQHLDPHHPSLMAEILGRRTTLHVKQAQEGDCPSPGTVYIAPPDRHLMVNPDGTLSLSQAALVHFLRPSGDLLFDSLAASYKERAIGVVLSGTGSDGAMGATAIKKMGGTVIVQDPATAEFDGMPSAAVRTGIVDHVLPLPEIASMLVQLVSRGAVQ
jgi:two-component system, chemotaxis family, protein-glutamate methylesterase/glutaminase